MSRLGSGQLIQDTYTKLHFHVVFSTKNRCPSIEDEWRGRLHDYIGGTIRGLGGQSISVGGVSDHVHVLMGLRPMHRLSDVMREVKHESSRWIQQELGRRVEWQKGYGAFTVSPLGCDRVRAYIADQEAHHNRVSPFLASLRDAFKR